MEEIKFEEALSRLETIVNDLEKGGLTLEESLKKFEEGIKLSDYCVKKLEEVEKKIEILSNGEIKPAAQGEGPPVS
ncbi:MAG: exodeoxyribonuclease VII small subunit [Omnitrophica WOR_2 bacterium RBG_13_44_8]|jgi:exodeoxyribonuclease VII small subunit|nr:MAG: exodeoxyribonuclease VII small subunit [Omnitrophica WOR_2 bacterium RBG_13_44_8]